MLNKNFKKVVASAILGLSVLTASAGVTGFIAPVTVQAAVRKPVINVKAKTISVGASSNMDVYKNVITSVKKGTYAVKSVKVTSVKAKNGKRISVKNSSILAPGKIPSKKLIFPSTAGTYKLKVTAADTKGNKSVSTVSFKVGKKLSSYVRGLKTYKVNVKSYIDFMKGVTFNKSYVKSIKVNSAAVNLDEVGNYKVYYTITGKAGDKLKVGKKVSVTISSSYTGPTLDAGPTNPTTPAPKPTTPAPSSNPADHVTGIKDRVVLRASKNLNLMEGVKGDDTIKSIECSFPLEGLDAQHFNLPAFGEKDSALSMYTHQTIDYLITAKSGAKKRVEAHLYVVDLPTAKDLANAGVKVYTSGNQLVAANPNSYHTCDIQVSATKIVVPTHKLEVCYNCNEEMKANDFDKLDEHELGSLYGWEGSVPGCGSTWYATVEGFTINR